jgi:hypothetical protein
MPNDPSQTHRPGLDSFNAREMREVQRGFAAQILRTLRLAEVGAVMKKKPGPKYRLHLEAGEVSLLTSRLLNYDSYCLDRAADVSSIFPQASVQEEMIEYYKQQRAICDGLRFKIECAIG